MTIACTKFVASGVTEGPKGEDVGEEYQVCTCGIALGHHSNVVRSAEEARSLYRLSWWATYERDSAERWAAMKSIRPR